MIETTKTYPRLVSWTYDDGKPLFGKEQNPEMITEVYIKNPAGEEILENSKEIFALNFFDSLDPYFEVTGRRGYTPRAKNHGKMYDKMKEKYPELENKLNSISNTKRVMVYGDKVFIKMKNFNDTPYESDETKELLKGKEWYQDYFVDKECFDKELVDFILRQESETFFKEPITAEDDIEEFLIALRSELPEVYAEAVKTIDKVKEFADSISFMNKEVLVTTLNSGQVKFTNSRVMGDDDIYSWDKDAQTLTKEYTTYDGLTANLVIKVNEKTAVTVIDESITTTNTKLA